MPRTPTQLHPTQLHPTQLHPTQLHPTQLHPTQYSGAGLLANPKSPALVGGQHYVTMYQDSMANGVTYSQAIATESQVPVAYATIENHQPHQGAPTSSPQTDMNNNTVDVTPSCSSMPTRIVTTVSSLGMANIGMQSDPHQTIHSSEPQTSGHSVVAMSVANGSNGYHGNIPIAALHNMAVPPSPGFFNGACK
jgi:hypothetical protein